MAQKPYYLKITRPRVYLLSAPQFNFPQVNLYLKDQGLQPNLGLSKATDGEILATVAGKACYRSVGEAKGRSDVNEYLSNLMDMGHFSVIEHANYTILVTGISRSCSHEFVRHRHFSYSQESQRYVDDEDMSFVVPSALMFADTNPNPTESTSGDVWTDAVHTAQEAYKDLVTRLMAAAPSELPKTEKRKWARQAARSVLPNATATKMVVTGNARSWRHFLNLRAAPGAEPEIRRLACFICSVLKEAAPIFFGDFTERPDYYLDSKYSEV